MRLKGGKRMKNKLFSLIKFIFNSEYRKKILIWNGYYDKMDDEKYLKMRYKLAIGKKLDLKNPQTFNEKMQWLKLYNRKPEYTMMVDKYKVREYIAEQLGEEYLIPLIGVWDSPDEIDFDSLPNQFVLKCNHNSGRGMCICKDKTKLDIEKVKEELRKGLEENYYLTSREWPYKDVPRKIICEKYMTDETGTELKDYKIHNFDGEPKIIEVDFDRFKSHKRNLYSTDWKYIENAIGYPNDASHQISKPEKLEKMLECAKKLAKDIPYVRTDFYSINSSIYFGEITFFHDGGWGAFSSEEFEEEFSSWLKLPRGGTC